MTHFIRESITDTDCLILLEFSLSGSSSSFLQVMTGRSVRQLQGQSEGMCVYKRYSLVIVLPVLTGLDFKVGLLE